MRVTVGIPTQWGLWRAQMGLSLIAALSDLKCDFLLSPQNGPYLDDNREASASDARADESDYLLFVDTDMAFPPFALRQLIEAKKDVIGANYYEKRLPLVSTVKMANAKGELLQDNEHVRMDLPTEPFPVAGLGAGLLCINMQRMVEMMAPPYFAFADQHGFRMGEDLAFCTRARKAGLQVWCDPTIPVAHIGDYPYGKFD